MKVKFFIIGALLMTTVGVAAAWWFLLRPDESTQSTQETTEQMTQPAADDGKIRFIATGDLIAHDSINENAKTSAGKYDYLQLMDEMTPFFNKAEMRFCNQATPTGGEALGITGYPVFNAPFELTHDMVALGCNVVNIGTNHTNDKGQRQIEATVTEWEKQTGLLAYAGANRSESDQSRQRRFEVEGVKFAFLSYTTYSNSPPSRSYSLNMYDSATAKQEVAAAHESADIVIVSMRWGTEYSPEVNTKQDQIAQELATAGADIILGHGPHVLEPVKRLEGRDGQETIVWFSLGNFLNSQLDIESLVSGLAIMDIDTTSKQVTDISFMPIYQHYEWTAAEKAKEDLLARRNFNLVPLDKAGTLLDGSLHGTSATEQTERVKDVLNRYTEVPLITSAEY